MPWRHNPLVWLSALAAASAVSPAARAERCENARPTQPGAALSYGDAEVGAHDSASGRARVHYALSGTHAPPSASTLEEDVPDAVVIAGQAADAALDRYAELGYRTPLSDANSPCSSNGGSEAIDIYLIQFAAADGQVVLDHCATGTPRRCAGFVLVENDFRSGGYRDTAEGLRTVVPHELFHLVQDSYDSDPERWWAEGSAQWAAKQVYPELRDLERFLPAYFDNPWRPLNVPPSGVITNFLYATAIWPVFLQERHEAALVREVFESLPGESGVLPATDRVLTARGSSLADEFLWFAAYNAATGERAPATGGYENASQYPKVELTPSHGARGELASDVASGMGAFYYSVSAAEATELSLEADPGRVAALLLPLDEGKARVDDAQPLPATLRGEGVVVVAGQTLERTDAPFRLVGKAPSSSDDEATRSSGCGLASNAADTRGFGGVALAFVVSLAGGWRARRASRKLRV